MDEKITAAAAAASGERHLAEKEEDNNSTSGGNQEDNDEDEEDEKGLLDGMRILFERSEPRMRRKHKVRVDQDNFEYVYIMSAKDVSGSGSSVQSGVYLWPACKSLSRYLAMQQFPILFNSETEKSINHSEHAISMYPIKNILIVEIGAGAGLSGLAAATSLNYRLNVLKNNFNWRVVLTDRDPHLLKMMDRSIELNKFQSQVFTREIIWANNSKDAENIVDKFLQTIPGISSETFLLLIGSDVIFSSESAVEVGCMVSQFLIQHQNSMCILSSSFRHPETTQILANTCKLEIGAKSVGEIQIKNVVDDIENTKSPSLIEEIRIVKKHQ